MRNMLLLLCTSLVFAILADASRPCTHTLQCGKGYFCEQNECRRDSCISEAQCEKNEKCRSGNINGKLKFGCFKEQQDTTTVNYCPGGALVLSPLQGLTTCDLSTDCPSTHVCNPIYGVCCTKINACPSNTKTMANIITGKPIMCQFKQGKPLPCPENGQCDTATGFCCLRNEPVEFPIVNPTELSSERPYLGQTCKPQDGCAGGASCVCKSRGRCMCECPTELGYTISNDGKTCQRIRRRLKEKCKTDMECSAAFSECSSGGCRCKRGFKRSGDGGCEPIEYRCANNQTPLKKKEEIVECSMKNAAVMKFNSLKNRKNATEHEIDEILNELAKETNQTMYSDNGNQNDDCPYEYYCVPVFEDPRKLGSYKGICCPSPSTIRPACPVGEPHESSYPPNYGCSSCPMDYYCHRDAISTDKSICCPKPCLSLEDIYYNGQCHSMVFYGDSCQISSQCVYSKNPDVNEEYATHAKMECLKGICSCPSGFSFADGECKRIICTIGLRGEPSVDRSGQLLRCDKSSDCSMGHMCDPNTRVCCKGTNRCPKGYVETGRSCHENCTGLNEICHPTKNGKSKLCCVYENGNYSRDSNLTMT
ncbi:unnamed protein product [Caenorhabditis bovis]|uniref:EB domain-containing protein n=1 Tax=Caenorhabditis bovis TaxID=2654633 RepID=A0A8S1EDM8_9PELO|nr:unnamed protein product [Caenorhabditis bovis]